MADPQCLSEDAVVRSLFLESLSTKIESLSSSPTLAWPIHKGYADPTVSAGFWAYRGVADPLEDQGDANQWSKYNSDPMVAEKHISVLPSTDAERSVHQLIVDIRDHLPVPYASRLAARIQALLEISEEEYPDQAPPETASLRDFLHLLQAVPGLSYPNVVLTQDGQLRAQWRSGDQQHFAVEFLGGGDVRFVAFAPDPRHPYKTIRVSGLATVDSLMDLVRPYHVLDWAATPAAEATA